MIKTAGRIANPAGPQMFVHINFTPVTQHVSQVISAIAHFLWYMLNGVIYIKI